MRNLRHLLAISLAHRPLIQVMWLVWTATVRCLIAVAPIHVLLSIHTSRTLSIHHVTTGIALLRVLGHHDRGHRTGASVAILLLRIDVPNARRWVWHSHLTWHTHVRTTGMLRCHHGSYHLSMLPMHHIVTVWAHRYWTVDTAKVRLSTISRLNWMAHW